MEQVLIVAKTIMGDGLCIGGLTQGNKSVRLIPQDRLEQGNYPSNTELRVGQVWEMEFQPSAEARPPHREDVMVTRQEYVKEVNAREVLPKRVRIWKGEPSALFDGLLTFNRTKAYLAPDAAMPSCSTGFWQPARNLVLTVRNSKHYYQVPYAHGILYVSYVGFVAPLEKLSAHTLIRVSLSRWWSPDEATEKRCYLQLSGWFL